MDNKYISLLEGFIIKCSSLGIADEVAICELLKIATDGVNTESPEKKKKPKSSSKIIDIDRYGLSGDPNRTNVNTTQQYTK